MNKESDCIFFLNFYGQNRIKVGAKIFSCIFPYLRDNKEIRVSKIDTFEWSSNEMIKESAHTKN
jgi:hypothetical protein